MASHSVIVFLNTGQKSSGIAQHGTLVRAAAGKETLNTT